MNAQELCRVARSLRKMGVAIERMNEAINNVSMLLGEEPEYDRA
jgi:hypothetical protein